jgi:hypothetical protein
MLGRLRRALFGPRKEVLGGGDRDPFPMAATGAAADLVPPARERTVPDDDRGADGPRSGDDAFEPRVRPNRLQNRR